MAQCVFCIPGPPQAAYELEHRRTGAQSASLRLFIQPVFKAIALGIDLPPRRSIKASSF